MCEMARPVGPRPLYTPSVAAMGVTWRGSPSGPTTSTLCHTQAHVVCV